MKRRLPKYLCLNDFEDEARRILPKPIYGYISATAEDGWSYKNNINSFRKYSLVTKVLVDTSERTQSTKVLGFNSAQPFGIAPVGLCALYAYRCDAVLAASAQRNQIPMIMSGSSLIPMEEVFAVNPDVWFQAYLPRQSDKMEALIARICHTGFKTLVVTVDTPVNSNKENFIRSGFSSPLRLSSELVWQGISHPRWLMKTFLKSIFLHGIPHFENNYATRGVPIISRRVERDFSDRGLNWKHFKLIRELWPHTLIIKGILNADDAATAVDLGADGVILSNHGGRQLDSTVSPFSVLPQIVARCPSIPIMLDGGIRRGTDVIKCLALGAKFVFLGRPFAYAAAAGGREGIEKAIDLLSSEINRNLAMLGVSHIAELTGEYICSS